MEKLLVIVACLAGTALSQGTAFALTTEQWQTILDMHNNARNTAAGGTQQGATTTLPSASDMNSLVWDAGLAELAQSTANTCDEFHSSVDTADLNTATTRFEIPATVISLGENLAFASAAPSFMIATLLTQAWLNEVDLYDFTTIPSGGDAATGHYTQIIWADTRYVGCAMSDCSAVTGASPSILVCQFYRPGNFIGQTPYTSGTACGSCDSDRTQQCVATNTGFENMCAGALDSTFGETNDGVSDITDDGLGRDISGSAPAPPVSASPSTSPTSSPSNVPSVTPTVSPSTSPTVSPNNDPSSSPTVAPSGSPTAATTNPSASPSGSPTSTPSNNPSTTPTAAPSGSPTAATTNPSASPSSSPSGTPSAMPTAATSNPSASPTGNPSNMPSNNPSGAPSATPTENPAQTLIMPSQSPSAAPTAVTDNPLYSLLAGLVGDTAARVILASDLTDAQVVALAALIASGADDSEILAFLQSTGISDAQVLAIAVALDLDLDGDDDSVSISDSLDDDDASS